MEPERRRCKAQRRGFYTHQQAPARHGEAVPSPALKELLTTPPGIFPCLHFIHLFHASFPLFPSFIGSRQEFTHSNFLFYSFSLCTDGLLFRSPKSGSKPVRIHSANILKIYSTHLQCQLAQNLLNILRTNKSAPPHKRKVQNQTFAIF